MNIVMGLRYTASLVQKQQDCSQSSFALKAHNNAIKGMQGWSTCPLSFAISLELCAPCMCVLAESFLHMHRQSEQLGLTVLRTWAFADGPQWNSIQPNLGQLDERVLSEVIVN